MITIRIQHPWNIEIFLGDIKGSIEVFKRIVFGKLVVVDEVGAMTMDEGAEGETVLERKVEVLDVDVLVRGRLPLAPQQQTFLGSHLFNGDVLDGESQNDGPNHAECHF